MAITPTEDLKSYYTAAELDDLQRQFNYMIVGQPVSFIIVDPSMTNQRILYALLQQAGYENVFVAKSGAEALGLLAKINNRIMVTIIDETVSAAPDYLAYLNQFRQMFPQGISFLTGTRLPPEKLAAAQKFGVAEYFKRPFKPAEFIAKIQEQVKSN
jgi:response regulator RpfG family c-di-GMP phosphodiesterase